MLRFKGTVVVFVILIIGCWREISCDEGPTTVFQTNVGKLRGSVMISDGGVEFFAFRGIPFAKPPVKELRFKEPQVLHDDWPGVLDATEDGAVCIQYNLFSKEMMGDEDCLYLNVYTPKVQANDQKFQAPLPVMVYIHGGGFFGGTGGSSLLGPQRLMKIPGIILVTFNYRLGPFGFLTTMDENLPGNYGLLDQVMALKWVRDNIAEFGGDPNHVTLFGESAGSAAVGFHLVSPLSKGLFHAAIAQSGSVLSEWAISLDKNMAVNNSKDLSKLLKCPTDCHKAMLKCLMRLPSLDIIIKTARLNEDRIDALYNLAFKPVVDGTSRGESAFLPDTPYNLIVKKQFNVVPIMSGVNKDEGILFMADCIESYDEHGTIINEEKLPSFLKSIVPSLFRNEEQWTNTYQDIISSYFKNVDVTDNKQKFEAIEDMISDSFINYKVDVKNELFAKYNIPVFVYKLTYRGEYSLSDGLAKDMVAHADDLQYLFRFSDFKFTTLSKEDKLMSDLILTLWTNFAKTKAPSFEGSFSKYPELKWEPITSNNYRFLELNLTPTMVNDHLSRHYDLWRNNYLGNQKDEL